MTRYTFFGALDTWWATTYSPTSPTSARLMLSMWRATGRPKIDGVISVDSVWTSYVLGVMGPVHTPAWPQPITEKNVSTIVGRDTFEPTSSDESDAEQSATAAALFDAILSRPIPPRPMGEAMARAARERHLQIYSTNPAEERQLEALGASGHLDLPSNPLMVSWFGATANRAGFFADKTVAYDATLNPDGSADVAVKISLHNSAPGSPPSVLLGNGMGNRAGSPTDIGVPVGTFGAYVNLYLPAAAAFTKTSGDSTISVNQNEFGHPVVMQYLQAASHKTVTTTIHYTLSHAIENGEFSLDVIPLPALNPDHITVTFHAPQGSAITEASPGLQTEGSSVSYDGRPVTPIALWVRLG